jgi:hypothetical protein
VSVTDAGSRFTRRDYYRILQVASDAQPEIIGAAYRALLRALRKHPDLGGTEAEAKLIIEAYTTLSHPERRHAYDAWLQAHAARTPAATVAARPAQARPRLVPDRLIDALRAALPEYRFTARAPFARAFDVVLQGPGLFAPRAYVKAFPVLTRASWPTIFVLCKALRVARRGYLPSTDLLVVSAGSVEDYATFVDSVAAFAAPWAWSRLLIAVHTPAAGFVHVRGSACMPRAFRKLPEVLSDGGREARPPSPSRAR